MTTLNDDHLFRRWQRDLNRRTLITIAAFWLGGLIVITAVALTQHFGATQPNQHTQPTVIPGVPLKYTPQVCFNGDCFYVDHNGNPIAKVVE